jgi:GNAT superfamily N-acetyltransferase
VTVSAGGKAALARAREFERGSVALVADEVARIPEGWVARSVTLPLVWDINHVGVDQPIEFSDAVALVERHLGDVPSTPLVVEHEPSGEVLEGQLRSDGWKVDRNVYMVLSGDPDRRLDTRGVIEADEAEALAVMARWLADDDEVRETPNAIEQVVEACRLKWRARGARRLGVRGTGGDLAGITMLFSDGVVAQVEDVYVAPEQRGRGSGRALVTRAALLALEAGHEFVFIAGDDEDWPKELYASVGFEAVGRCWVFHR